ncbi:MAG: hypothetical protein RLZZ618_311 [Pseudomonadota bacterium]|jgi:EAL domain-containing protein (putative c-di-GMP-specific phosphodiesterase class I)
MTFHAPNCSTCDSPIAGRRPAKRERTKHFTVSAAIERAILSSLLDMGRSLAVSTVAEGVEGVEGVETVEDWNFLSELGCDIIQGYLVAKPMPAEQRLGWTMGHRARLRKLASESAQAKPSAKA